MPFISGSVELPITDVDGTVTFASPFVGLVTPPMVILWVENYSADDPKFLINAFAVDADDNGFTYRLDGSPNSVNYVMGYFAGTPNSFFSAVSSLGRRVTETSIFTGSASDRDLVPFVSMSPVPKSWALTIGKLRSMFLSMLPGVPTSPGITEGLIGNIYADDDYLYVRRPTGSARIGLSTSTWAISDKAVKRVQGVFQCVSGQQVQTITFDDEFPATPTVVFSIRNTEAVAKLMLHGMQTGGTVAACEITLSSPPDSSDYYIIYEASCPMPA